MAKVLRHPSVRFQPLDVAIYHGHLLHEEAHPLRDYFRSVILKYAQCTFPASRRGQSGCHQSPATGGMT